MEIFTKAEFFLKLEDNHFLFIKLVQHSQKKKKVQKLSLGRYLFKRYTFVAKGCF